MLERVSNKRSARGALIFLFVALAVFTMALLMFVCQIGHLLIEKERYQQALESAALRAATELSEIVINDPYFGFISLSDQGAIGRGTIAQDGEALPVHGINTIIATSRLDYIVACEVGDGNLQQIALQDVQHAREAAACLNAVLEKALKPKAHGDPNVPRDMDGNEVHPYVDALLVYKKSLQSFTKADPGEFQLTLGWLRNGGGTITPVPVSITSQSSKDRNQRLPQGTASNGCYRAFVDVPVASEHFSLASLGAQPTLVNVNQFVPKRSRPIAWSLEATDNDPDLPAFVTGNCVPNPQNLNKYVSSIVKAKAVWRFSNLFGWNNDKLAATETGQACAQPYAVATLPAPSVLILTFVDGLPPNIYCMSDLLADQGLNQSVMDVYSPANGDYGIDADSQLQSQRIHPSAAWAFAVCFHDWLRSNYTLPKIESVLATLNQNLASVRSSLHSICVIEVAADGNVVTSELLGNPFGSLIVQENQLSLTSDTPVSIGGHSWSINCRDEVHTLGTLAGGKHAGQPLFGDPVNWDVLSSYVDERLAQAAASRRLGGIMVTGQENQYGGIPLMGAQLRSANGENIDRNLRTSTYSAGLAAEMVLSYPRRPLR